MSWHIEWGEGGADAANPTLCERWDAAFEDNGNIYQSRQLIRCWEDTIARDEGKKAFLAIAKDHLGHEVVYCMYSHQTRMFGLKRSVLEPAGAALDFDYQDPVAIGAPMSDSDWTQFWQCLHKSACLHFSKIGLFAAYRISNDYSGGLGEVQKINGVSPFLPLEEFADFDDVLKQCGSSHRSNVRRRLRQAERIGPLSLHLVPAQEIDQALEEMFACYADQWGYDDKPHYFMRPIARTFYQTLAHTAADLGKLHFSYVKVGGDIWNWHFGLLHNGSLLWLKPTYTQGFQKNSPGLVHLALLIKHGLEHGLREIDFGYGPEPYKYLWTKQERTLRSLEFFADDPLFTGARRVHATAVSGHSAIMHSKLADYVRWKWKTVRTGNSQR